MTLLSTKPYLIRAIYEWCVDQGFTPYLQVAVDARCRVPREHVRDGHIVFNIGTAATSNLILGNEDIQFQARFSGAAFSVLVPVDSIGAIYARENGQGMAFDIGAGQGQGDTTIPEEEQTQGSDPGSTEDSPDPKPRGGRPRLTRIK